MSWFSELTGFTEQSPDQVRSNLQLNGTCLHSKVNGRSVECGRLDIVSLDELRAQVAANPASRGKLKVSSLLGDVRDLHADPSNAGGLFQVASQFNLLEMISPDVTPEQGITRYQNDATQGPACAVACGAGTIFRNYFVEWKDQIGQTAAHQVDCLHDVGVSLGNFDNRLWTMKNGYALPTLNGLREVDSQIKAMSEDELDLLRSKLKIGIQWDTQVTLSGCDHLVTQAYCSALPVAYSSLPELMWERFARLVLEAAYEATFCAAFINASCSANRSLYLTSLGGGAFGNDPHWITDAIERACRLFQNADLDVKIVSYRNSSPAISRLCENF
jgi:hypothetical protein